MESIKINKASEIPFGFCRISSKTHKNLYTLKTGDGRGGFTGTKKSSPYVGLGFSYGDKAYEIGTTQDLSEDGSIPLGFQIIFDKEESLDCMISALTRLKDNFKKPESEG